MRDQVGEAETEVVRFAFHGALRPIVALPSQFADSLGGQPSTMGIVRGGTAFEPTDHGRARRQGFPASAKAA